MIRSSEISVVIQGNISIEYINICISSIKMSLPNAEIILSTWHKERKKILYLNLNCDKYIFSKDPGAVLLNKQSKALNNINRQIISTQKGIRIATRKYILKCRSNISVMNNKFLNIYEKYSNNADFFQNKLLVVDYYTRNPRVVPMPFHPSDWILFGLAEDVKKYYDIFLQSKKESLWFINHKNKSNLFKNVYALFAPEQYICISFLKKCMNIKCVSYYDNSKENILLTERFFARNMIIINSKKNGIIFLKYNPNRYFEKSTILSHNDWCFLNKKYRDKSIITLGDKLIYKLKNFIRYVEFFYIRKSIGIIISILGLKKILKNFIEKD